MRVTLNQNEIFEAITDYLGKTMKLDNSAKVEIALTAGRNPKGYYADVDITYPRSETAVICVAAAQTDDGDTTEADGLGSNPHAEALGTTVNAGETTDTLVAAGTKSADDIFN